MFKVLVVDDEAEVTEFLCRFLRRFKISSEPALDGKSAIESFIKTKHDWVFLDIKMPGMDGLDVLEKLKQIKPTANVIMISGRDDKSAQARAKELGALDYIIKPIDLERLHDKINTYILKGAVSANL